MSSSPRSIGALTSIRGLAVMWVYLYHCQMLPADGSPGDKFRGLGYFGVDVFFVLSGFIMAYVHLADFRSPTAVRERAAHFLGLRLARIYPLHLVTLLLLVALNTTPPFGGNPDNNLDTFVRNLFLVHAWWGDHLTWNLVAWSISVEWALYLLFPLLACFVLSRLRDVASNLLFAALSIALAAVFCLALPVEYSSLHEPGVSVVRGLLDFTLGGALFNLYRLNSTGGRAWDVAGFACLGGFALVVLWVTWLPPRRHVSVDLVLVALSGALILCLALSRGALRAIFEWRPLVYLGEISYSIYLVHWIYLMATTVSPPPVFQDMRVLSWQFALLTAGLLACSALSYHLLERPTRSVLRALLDAQGARRLKWVGFAGLALVAPAIYALMPQAAVKQEPVVASAATAAATAAPVAVLPPAVRAMYDMAQRGDRISQYNLAVRYYAGDTLERDYSQAYRWFEASAAQGFAPAHYSVGNMLANGLGVPADPARADAAYRRAAELGSGDGQLALGLRLQSGGDARQLAEAYFWLVLSDIGGNPSARAPRQQLAHRIGPDAARIEAEAKAWKPTR